MSPEQAEGKPADPRSDVFSFGTVLYEMVTGRRAFRGDSRMSTLAAILTKEPEPPSRIVRGLPRDLETLIARCLRKSPERRWQSMADLKVALEELREEAESAALDATRPAAVNRWTAAQWRTGVYHDRDLTLALGIGANTVIFVSRAPIAVGFGSHERRSRATCRSDEQAVLLRAAPVRVVRFHRNRLGAEFDDRSAAHRDAAVSRHGPSKTPQT